MPNPFQAVNSEVFTEPAAAPSNPFAAANSDVFQDLPPVVAEPVDIQRSNEKALTGAIMDHEKPAENSDHLALASSLYRGSPGNDLPTPKNYPEAISDLTKRFGVDFVPNPEVSDEIEKLSDRMVWSHLRNHGLVDEQGAVAGVTQDTVDRMRGAYMANMALQYADLSDEEVPKITARALRTVLEASQQTFLSQLNAKTEEINLLRKQGKEVPERDLQELQAIQQNFALTRSYHARAGEGKVQQAFLYQVAEAARSTDTLSGGADLEAGVLKGLLDHALPGDERLAAARGGIASRMGFLLSAGLQLRDSSGKAKPYGNLEAVQLAFRGSLTKERLAMIGVPDQLQDTMTPTSMLYHTHPTLVAELGNIKAMNEARRANSHQPPEVYAEKVEQWLAENGASIADTILASGLSPVMELKRQLDTATHEGFAAFQDGTDKFLNAFSQFASLGSDAAGDALGAAQKFYGSIASLPSDAELARSLQHSMEDTAIGAFAQQVQETAGETLKDMAKERGLVTGKRAGEGMLGHRNKWLGDIDALTEVAADSGRLGLTKEAQQRIFDTKGNGFRQAAIWLADEIAASTVNNLAPLGFHPSTIREAYQEARAGEFGRRLDRSLLAGITEEEYQEYVKTTARVQREKGVGAWKETIALGVMGLAKNIRQTTEFLMSEPDDLAVVGAVGLATGFVGNMATTALKRETIGRMAAIYEGHRGSIVLRQALRNDASAVHKLRGAVNELGSGVGPGQRAAIMEATNDALDYIANQRSRALVDNPEMRDMTKLRQLGREVDTASRRASEIMDHISPGEREAILTSMGVDANTRTWISQGGLFSTLRETVKNSFNLRAGNRNIPMSSAASAGLFEKIAENPELSRLELPFVPEVMTAENLPFLQRLVPGRARDMRQALAQRKAVEWMADYRRDTLYRRSIGAENRANLEDFTKFARSVEAGRLERIRAFRDVATPEEHVELNNLRERSLRRVAQGRAVRQELLESGTPFDRTRLRDHPIFEDYTAEQLLTFVTARHDSRYVWNLLRDEFEGQNAFWARMRSMGSRFDVPDEAASAAAAKVKRRLIYEYFEQPGLSDTINMDPSALRRRRRVREAKELGRAFLKDEVDKLRLDPDNPDLPIDPSNPIPKGSRAELVDELLAAYDDDLARVALNQDVGEMLHRFAGRRNLKEAWAEIEASAATQRANRLVTVAGVSGAAQWGGMAEAFMSVTDGRLSTHLADAKAMGIQQKLLARAHIAKQNTIQNALSKLSKDEQRLFDAAYAVARDEGITGPLAALRKRFPKYFDEVAPETDDLAVQNLLNQNENFRKSFLRDLKGAGMIDAKTYDKLAGPYGARLFTSNLVPRLYGTDGVDLGGVKSKIGGQTIGGLASQRHHSQWKAQIYAKGGRPITQHFDSEQAAQKWVADNYGRRGKAEAISLEEDIGSSGNTASGSQYAILRPLGGEAAKLGEIGAGKGTFIQMRNLFEDMFQSRLFSAFDRPGVSMTDKAFKQLVASNPQKARKFVRVPESAKFGALSGKYVHNNVARQLDHFSEMKLMQHAISDAVEERAVSLWGDVNAMIGKGVEAALKFDAAMKSAISHNLIARNITTVIGNFVSDAMLFTRLAAGPDINFTRKGWAAGVEAWDVIRGLRNGKLTFDDLPVDIRRGIELGVVDEGIFQAAGLMSTRRDADVQAIFGDQSGREVFLSPLKDKRLEAVFAREEQLKALLASPNLSPARERQFLKERTALSSISRSDHSTLAKVLARAADVSRSFVGINRGRFGDVQSLSASFYGDLGNVNRLRAYIHLVREKGHSPESAASRVDKFMQTYSKVGTTEIGRRVQQLGKTPFLGSPIVSFPFELSRITGNALKENIGGMMGLAAASLSRNMMGIAANGQDPYAAMEHLGVSDHPLSLLKLLGVQNIPLPDQTSMVISNQALSAFSQIGSNFGAANGLAAAWDDHGDDTPLASVMRIGTSMATNFAFTAPSANFAMGMVGKLDSFTGRQTRDGNRLMADNLQRLFQPLIHPNTPLVGSFAEKLNRVVEGFPLAYSRREHNLINKSLELTGFKVSGDVTAALDALPPIVGDPVKAAAAGSARLLTWLHLWEDPEDRVLVGQSRGLDEQDYFAKVVASSSHLDPQGGRDMNGAIEKSVTDLRGAIRDLESEDPTILARGKERFARAIEDIRALRTTREQADFLGGGREATDREVKSIVTRIMSLGDGFENAMEGFSVRRRVGILAKMASTRGVSDEMVDSLWRQVILTANGGIRAPSSSEEIGATRDALEVILAEKGPLMSPINIERLSTLGSIMEAWQAKAEMQEEVQNVVNAKFRAFNDLLKKAR